MIKLLERLYSIINKAENPSTRPVVAATPIEAIYEWLSGREVYFMAPIQYCVAANGFGFGPDSWHPFVATAKNLLSAPQTSYETSVLEHYYDMYQPKCSASAMFASSPPRSGVPSVAPYVLHPPWDVKPLLERKSHVEFWAKAFQKESGLDPAKTHGIHFHGPVSSERGSIEIDRLRRVVRSFKDRGWDPEISVATCVVILRGEEIRFLVKAGNHRTAVAGALGLSRIPLSFERPAIVRQDEAEHFTRVVDGTWSPEAARKYIDHLFDYDARTWAQQRNLL